MGTLAFDDYARRHRLCGEFFVLAAISFSAGLLSLKSLVAIPQALLLVLFSATAISLFLSLLGPFFKDLDELSRILLRVLFYTSPITYPMSAVPERFAVYLWVNPMTVLAEGVRNSFVFGLAPYPFLTSSCLCLQLH